MKKRLVAFGCGNTYGHGLVDCITEDWRAGPVPSKNAWPSLLASKLDLICVNAGIPGASVKEIWHKIIYFDFEEDDTVIIMWPDRSRWCIFKDNNEIFQISNQLSNKVSKTFYSYLNNPNDRLIELNLYMSHVHLLLTQKNVKNYHLNFSFFNFVQESYNDSEVIKLSIEELKNQYPLAKDKIHPGALAHEAFATQLHIILDTK